MTPEDFIDGIQKEIIDAGIRSYRELYEQPRVMTSEISLFAKLSEEEKEVFFSILKQVRVDTVATFLALLDGAYLLGKQQEVFKLVCLDRPEETINGELADLFLSKNYDWGR